MMDDMEVESPPNQAENTDGNDKSKENKSFWHIDKDMLPFKIHFLLYEGAVGTLLPFQPAIGITRLGLKASNLAVVYTVHQFLIILMKPVIGYIADYFNNLKGMIITLTVVNAVLSFLLLALPPVGNKSATKWNGSHVGSVNEMTSFCKFCYVSTQLQRIVETLPENTDLFENEISCTEKSNINQQVFISHCPKMSTNYSVIFNTTYKIMYKFCKLTSNNGNMQSKINVISNLDKKFYKIFISITQNSSFPQFIIVCPQTNGFPSLRKMNFSVEYIATSCYSAPQSKIVTFEKLFSIVSGPPMEEFCNETEVNKEYIQRKAVQSDSFHTYQFWLFTLMILISCTCTSSIFTLSDTACYESVQLTGADYGQQRAWGAVGWGLMAPFAGFLNDYTDNYWASMLLMTIICLLMILNLSKLNLIKPQFSKNILKDIKTVTSSTEFLAFEIGVFMNGMGIGVVWFYLTWFITDIGGSRLLVGLANTFQSFLGEMPVMLVSGWLLKRFGHFNVVSLALFCHCVRFLAYSSLTNPWFILPVETLDGITFGAFYTAMTSYGKLNAKPGTEATTQAVLSSTYEGLGAGLGCVIAGVCFDYFGGYCTFFYAGLCFAAASAINVTITLVLRCKKGLQEV